MKRIIFYFVFFSISLVSIYFVFDKEENEFIEERSIFISYIELSKYLNQNEEISKKNIDNMLSNVEMLGFNSVILQVRSFADAIYPSKIFYKSLYVSSSFDILDYFVDLCIDKGFKIYAWINPYRIRSSIDLGSIKEDDFLYNLLETRHVVYTNGIYFNPSSELVIDLIVDGVEEIVSNYKVTGVLFDDYFYPSNDCDLEEYNKLNSSLSYEEYKIDRVNVLIRSVYEVCKKNNVLFGISPDGNISNNYSKHSADVKTWLSSDKYVDFIMPQIYYGFFNSSKPFKNTVSEWESLIKNKNIKLNIALAFYKNGSFDEWAKDGKYEWINNDDIIMKEIIVSRNLDKYVGFSLFRYDYLFSEDKFTLNTFNEIKNMKKVID